MASFKAVHPYVRESSFRHGFVPDGSVRVKHSHKRGKKAQFAFKKAFDEATKMPGVKRVEISGAMGTTLSFPEVSEDRWEAAQIGETWYPEIPKTPARALRTWDSIKKEREEKDNEMFQLADDKEPVKAQPVSQQANMSFSGTTDDSGNIVNLHVNTSSNATARALLDATVGRAAHVATAVAATDKFVISRTSFRNWLRHCFQAYQKEAAVEEMCVVTGCSTAEAQEFVKSIKDWEWL